MFLPGESHRQEKPGGLQSTVTLTLTLNLTLTLTLTLILTPTLTLRVKRERVGHDEWLTHINSKWQS